MRTRKAHFVIDLLLLCVTLFTSQIVSVHGSDQKNFYIVFLGDRPADEISTALSHVHVLSSIKESQAEAKEAVVYSYTKSFNAFAAKLSADEANKLSQMDKVVSVIPNGYKKLHTTRSWDFIGLPLTSKRKLKSESDIIVGLLDTGITPESESFKDDGLGPPPAKWKGTCDVSANFTACNNKIIGARYFKLDGNPDPVDLLSPADVEGHGTHTASTAVGDHIQNASLFGLAAGTARGAVPGARVAMYKVCWVSSGCSDMDILAAFDAAIHDGVDVISISIGGGFQDYATDSIAVGSFHAMQRGIITVSSAGNGGPNLGGLFNHAPWLVTVAASGIDRGFKSQIQLGNGNTLFGNGITFNANRRLFPLVSGADVALASHSKEEARFCFKEALDPKKLKGKVVFCQMGGFGTDAGIKQIGGAGTIIESFQFLDTAQIYMSPATMVNLEAGELINRYINTTRLATAAIHKTQQVRIWAPFIASFSSRGPSAGSLRVLKPDIAAPGVDILASYTPLKSLTGLEGDTQFSKFTIMSGTSMACPHVAGVAAYVKSFHPHWSPAAIRSAILTTARPMSRRVNLDGEFAYGAGQVNPRHALNPGLVYDMNYMNYVQFLCTEGYKDAKISALVGPAAPVNCSSFNRARLGYDSLNLPTFQLTATSALRRRSLNGVVGVFRRVVTNVGPAGNYTALVRAPKGVNVIVTPTTLSFSRALQKRSFKVVVTVARESIVAGQMFSASLAWKSARYVVRSPIVVYCPFEDNGRLSVVKDGDRVRGQNIF